MWKDLSMKEKAAFMRVAVKNGIYDINEIQSKYNSFLDNKPINKYDGESLSTLLMNIPWYSRLNSILTNTLRESGASMADARIGSVGLLNIRDTYVSNPELANRMAEDYFNANMIGASIPTGITAFKAAPVLTVGALGLGAIGDYTTNAAVRATTPYSSWGNMVTDKTGIPLVFTDMSNPGATLGGMAGAMAAQRALKGTNLGRAFEISRALNLGVKSSNLSLPSIASKSIGLTNNMPIERTNYSMYERPSYISEKERLGIPKEERNIVISPKKEKELQTYNLYFRNIIQNPNKYKALPLAPETSKPLMLPLSSSKDLETWNRNFLKEVNHWGLRYGYTPIDLSVSKQGTLATELAVKNRLLEHNTFVRGVSTLSDNAYLGDFRKRLYETPLEWYKRLDSIENVGYNERQKYMTAIAGALLEKLGIPNTAENRAKLALTYYAPNTGAGRAGTHLLPNNLGTIYTSNAEDLASSYSQYNLGNTSTDEVSFIGKVRRPFTFSADRNNWTKDADFLLRKSYDSRLSNINRKSYNTPWTLDEYDRKKLLHQKVSQDPVFRKIYNNAVKENIQKNYKYYPYNPNRQKNKETAIALEAELAKEGINVPRAYVPDSDIDISKIVEKIVLDKNSNKDKWKVSDKIQKKNDGYLDKTYIQNNLLSLINIEANKVRKKHYKKLAILANKETESLFLFDFPINAPISNLYPYDVMTTENMFRTTRNSGDPYQHFIFIGPKNEKGLDFVEFIDPVKQATRSHSHDGRQYTPGLSRKSRAYGGDLFTTSSRLIDIDSNYINSMILSLPSRSELTSLLRNQEDIAAINDWAIQNPANVFGSNFAALRLYLTDNTWNKVLSSYGLNFSTTDPRWNMIPTRVSDTYRSNFFNSDVRSGREQVAKESAPIAIGAMAAPLAGPAMALLNKFATTTVGKLLDTGLTALGVYNLFTDNGVLKTYRHLKEGEYGKAALSGLGDALDAVGTLSLARTATPFAKKLYNSATKLGKANNVNTLPKPEFEIISNYLVDPLTLEDYKASTTTFKKPNIFRLKYIKAKDFLSDAKDKAINIQNKMDENPYLFEGLNVLAGVLGATPTALGTAYAANNYSDDKSLLEKVMSAEGAAIGTGLSAILGFAAYKNRKYHSNKYYRDAKGMFSKIKKSADEKNKDLELWAYTLPFHSSNVLDFSKSQRFKDYVSSIFHGKRIWMQNLDNYREAQSRKLFDDVFKRLFEYNSNKPLGSFGKLPSSKLLDEMSKIKYTADSRYFDSDDWSDINSAFAYYSPSTNTISMNPMIFFNDLYNYNKKFKPTIAHELLHGYQAYYPKSLTVFDGNYFKANKDHYLYNTFKSLEGPDRRSWIQSPDELDAESAYMRELLYLLYKIPYNTYNNYSKDMLHSINEYLQDRFELSPENTTNILKTMSEHGFALGGPLFNLDNPIESFNGGKQLPIVRYYKGGLLSKL